MTANLPQERQATPVDRLKYVMSSASVQEQFRNALANKSDQFVASLIDLYAGDTYLQQCPPQLVVMEALKAATLNLPINKSLGFAYIVPYAKSKKVGDKWVKEQIPTFQIGYKGLIQLAMRSGIYRYINAGPVYEGEYLGENKLTGEIDISGKKSGDQVVGYFAYIESVNGFKKTMYMSRANMEAYSAKYSKSAATNNSPWKTEFDAMAEKTMLRRLIGKYGLMTIEMGEAIASEDETGRVAIEYQGIDQELIDIPPPPHLGVDKNTGEVLTPPPPEEPADDPGF